jgi:hypothetical protein
MLKPETVKQLRRELEKLENWEREIEASCPRKFYEKVASIPAPLPSCKLTGKMCDYNYCPKRK